MAKSRPEPARRKRCALRGSVRKRRRGRVRWLETEWSEGRAREAGRPARRAEGGVHARREPKSRERRAGVRAAIVARKRRNGRGAKGRRKVDGVRDRATEARPAAVPEEAKQAGEVRARWAWTEPTVWTERMLTALEAGGERRQMVQPDGQGLRRPQPARPRGSRCAPTRGRREWIGRRSSCSQPKRSSTWSTWHEELRAGTYEPQAVRRCWIPKAGQAGEATAGDPDGPGPGGANGAAHGAGADLRAGLSPHSYGFRPGRGCKDALRRVERAAR